MAWSAKSRGGSGPGKQRNCIATIVGSQSYKGQWDPPEMARPIWAREPALRLPGWNPLLEMPQRYILFFSRIFLIKLVQSKYPGIKIAK